MSLESFVFSERFVSLKSFVNLIRFREFVEVL